MYGDLALLGQSRARIDKILTKQASRGLLEKIRDDYKGYKYGNITDPELNNLP